MTTTVGIRSKDGVVLAADKRASKGFFVGSKVVQKIFSLDGATAVAIAGAMSDAEYLVNLAKAERRLLALRRGYPLSVKESAKLISNIVYSSMKSYNPFYVELVVAGVDREGGNPVHEVSRRPTARGRKTNDSALLPSQDRPPRPLLEPADKVYVADDHNAATGSGDAGDVTTLLDQGRVAPQRHRRVYDE